VERHTLCPHHGACICYETGDDAIEIADPCYVWSGCSVIGNLTSYPAKLDLTARRGERENIRRASMKTEFFGVAPLLQVYDMPTAVRFYRDVLGFALVNQSNDGEEFDWCLLARNSAELMLNAMYERHGRPSEPDLKRSDAHGDIGMFFACSELNAVYEHLRAHGVDVKPPSTAPYGMRQLSFKDPDGYGICFQWPVNERWARRWHDRYGLDF